MRYLRDEGPYPRCFRRLPDPPRLVTTTGPLEREGRRAIAIVGSREPSDGARAFAQDLAAGLAERGVIVVSGGAVGVDAAAHRGALAAGGATWAVLPTAVDRSPFPPENRRLFQAVSVAPEGRVVWCVHGRPQAKYRNGVLCALADAVIVVQAHYRSGSLNAAHWAMQLRKPLWMVPSAPWDGAYTGALPLLGDGRARPLWSCEGFLAAYDRAEAPGCPAEVHAAFWGSEPAGVLPWPGRTRKPTPATKRPRGATPVLPGLRSQDEKAILSALSATPTHVDELVHRSGVCASSAVTALLTLALEDVVVEGPDGYFRLHHAE